jgi:hypothetical protein
MELKHLVQRFVYKIEPKPEGGFIARAADPTVPPLEAPTRAELQQKIQAKLAAALGEAFPGLQIPSQGKQLSFQVHIDRKPEGGFAVHSEETDQTGINPATHEKLDHAAEQVLGFIDKHFPHLSEQFAAQVTGRDLQVFTTQKGNITLDTVPAIDGAEVTQPVLAQPTNLKGPKFQFTTANQGNMSFNNTAIANTPITPEPTRIHPIVRFLLMLLVIAALIYFFIYRR